MGASAKRGTVGIPFAAWRVLVVLAVAITAMMLPASAPAHTDPASYWPDPAPDCIVEPCAGGEVPTARSLASAAFDDRGSTRVVCKTSSLRRVQRSITIATRTGYVVRPSLGVQ